MPGDAAERPMPQVATPLRLEGFAPRAPRPSRPSLDLGALADKLRGIAAVNEAGYPEIGRAVDLLRLGEIDAAEGELYEVFLDYRAAIGRPIRRAGLEAVARGGERPVEPMTHELRRASLDLTAGDRRAIAEVAAALGDYGTAVGIGPDLSANDRPRAYEEEVEQAAAAFGLDPNLIFAVMRVESVYQRRIVSYASAIGLTQIMPRTGRLIAHQLGYDDFTTADLLDPAINLRFCAWYLSSLIRRFDGHLPLAIASYNGGPHNVREWIEEHSQTLPLDALLERIPFSQTHRYVRRVLTHYAAYRAQQGLPMQPLSVTLPAPEIDHIAF
jgi:soluble lytic murein transglycosylase